MSCRVTGSARGAFPMKRLKKFCARTRTRKVRVVSPIPQLVQRDAPHISISDTLTRFLPRLHAPQRIFDCLRNVVSQYYFTVTFNHDNQKALELRTEDVKDCDEWVAAITQARYTLTRNLSPYRRALEEILTCQMCQEYACVSSQNYRTHDS